MGSNFTAPISKIERSRLVKVSCSPLAPVVVHPSSPLHLDALLSAVHPAMHDKGKVTRQGASGVEYAPLPLLRALSPDAPCDWIFAASAMEVSADAELSTVSFTKRRDGVDVLMGERQITPGMGPMRDRMTTAIAVLAREVFFFAVCYDTSELSRLLRRISHIGGMRKQGYGEVCGWGTEELGGYDRWRESLVLAGKARRFLPASFCNYGFSGDCRVQSLGAIRPPYWHHVSDTQRVDVGAGVILRERLTCS